jgi:hypothetical protein
MSVKTLVQAHNAGAIDIKQFNNGIVQLKRSYESTFGVSSQKATAEIRRFTKTVRDSVPHVNQAASELNRFGVVAQQTGYQVSDFIVQVQGGTNPLVAFSQQATQLAGLLYYMPERFMAARLGVLGFSMSVATAVSVVTIGIPLLAMLAMNFLSSGEDADKGAEGVDKYKEALDGLKSSIQSTQAEINKLSFGTEDDAVAGARKAMQDAQAEVARLTASQTKVRGQFAPTEEESAAIEAAVKNYRDLVINLNELTAKQQAYAEAQRMLNGDLSVAAGIQRGLVYDKTVELRLNGELTDLQREIRDYAVEFAQTDLASGVEVAAAAALELARNLGVSLETAQGMIALGYGAPVVFDPRDPNFDPERASAARAEQLQKDRFGFTYGTSVTGTKFNPQKSGGGAARIKKETEAVKELTAAEKERQTILQSIEGSLESGFMAMVDGTKSVKDAFRSMARDIIKELYNVLVVQRLVGSFDVAKGTGSGLVGFLGKAFTGQLATGGSVMPGKSYLVGENGPELVIPRHSGTVVNANQTAGAAGGNGTTVVNNNISVTGSDAAMVRAEVAKMIPQITNATKAAVIDARLRGGQMKSAFR